MALLTEGSQEPWSCPLPEAQPAPAGTHPGHPQMLPQKQGRFLLKPLLLTSHKPTQALPTGLREEAMASHPPCMAPGPTRTALATPQLRSLLGSMAPRELHGTPGCCSSRSLRSKPSAAPQPLGTRHSEGTGPRPQGCGSARCLQQSVLSRPSARLLLAPRRGQPSPGAALGRVTASTAASGNRFCLTRSLWLLPSTAQLELSSHLPHPFRGFGGKTDFSAAAAPGWQDRASQGQASPSESPFSAGVTAPVPGSRPLTLTPTG